MLRGRGRAHVLITDLLALLLLGIVAVSDLRKYNGGFDALAYHLPFAALRTGILTPDHFVLPPLLADRLVGFPPLAGWIQGGLWLLFGRVEAAALIAPLGVLGFALYAHAVFGVGMLWSCLIFLAVPVLHTGLDGMYVDVWTNAAFAVHLLAAYRAITRRGNTARDALVSMLALAVAVWSKPQFAVVGGISLLLIVVLAALRAWRLRLAGAFTRPAWRVLAVCALLAPLAFGWPLRNVM